MTSSFLKKCASFALCTGILTSCATTEGLSQDFTQLFEKDKASPDYRNAKSYLRAEKRQEATENFIAKKEKIQSTHAPVVLQQVNVSGQHQGKWSAPVQMNVGSLLPGYEHKKPAYKTIKQDVAPQAIADNTTNYLDPIQVVPLTQKAMPTPAIQQVAKVPAQPVLDTTVYSSTQDPRGNLLPKDPEDEYAYFSSQLQTAPTPRIAGMPSRPARVQTPHVTGRSIAPLQKNSSKKVASIYFAREANTLSRDDMRVLKQVAKLHVKKGGMIDIQQNGSNAVQAGAVAAFLTKQGVSPNRIKTSYNRSAPDNKAFSEVSVAFSGV